MYLVSLLSPVAMFLAYFFNACIAHNLYITFYGYKNTYGKRIYVYKIGALVGSVFVFILSLLFNHGSYDKTEQISVKFYPLFYLGLIYLIGGLIGVYMLIRILFVIKKKNDFFNMINKDDPDNEERINVLTIFIKRHISFIISFLICYGPNNIIILIQLFSWYKICYDCDTLAISVYLMSLSCTITFVLKMSEPYMMRYFKLVFNYVFRKEVLHVDQTQHDYSSIYNDGNNMIQNNDNNENAPNVMMKMDNSGNTTFNNQQRPIELNVLEKEHKEIKNLRFMADTFDVLNKEMECNDFIARMVALNLAIDEDRKYGFDPKNDELFKTFLPWMDNHYTAKSEFVSYNYPEKDLPEWINIKELSKFSP
jgi:hypothetical protein